ncbi:MAG: hypothetical protein LBF05_05760 [Tannerella sp.]|nr:hypothetical protein [Tannerella sp.]
MTSTGERAVARAEDSLATRKNTRRVIVNPQGEAMTRTGGRRRRKGGGSLSPTHPVRQGT